MLPAELYKLKIGVRAVPIHNKQSVAIVFDVWVINSRGLPCLCSPSITLKMLKPLKTHFFI